MERHRNGLPCFPPLQCRINYLFVGYSEIGLSLSWSRSKTNAIILTLLPKQFSQILWLIKRHTLTAAGEGYEEVGSHCKVLSKVQTTIGISLETGGRSLNYELDSKIPLISMFDISS